MRKMYFYTHHLCRQQKPEYTGVSCLAKITDEGSIHEIRITPKMLFQSEFQILTEVSLFFLILPYFNFLFPIIIIIILQELSFTQLN